MVNPFLHAEAWADSHFTLFGINMNEDALGLIYTNSYGL